MQLSRECVSSDESDFSIKYILTLSMWELWCIKSYFEPDVIRLPASTAIVETTPSPQPTIVLKAYLNKVVNIVGSISAQNVENTIWVGKWKQKFAKVNDLNRTWIL